MSEPYGGTLVNFFIEFCGKVIFYRRAKLGQKLVSKKFSVADDIWIVDLGT